MTESLLIKLTEINPFDWDTSAEARDLWLGYPISPRVTPDLWPELRPFLLKVFPHSGELGEYEEIFDSFFAFVLLNSDLHLGPADARSALKVASAKGRAQVANYWSQQVNSPTDYGAKLYRQRLKYLLTEVWPLDQGLRDEAASECLAALSSHCTSEFPDAVATVRPYLTTISKPSFLLSSIVNKDLAEKYPDPLLGSGSIWQSWKTATSPRQSVDADCSNIARLSFLMQNA